MFILWGVIHSGFANIKTTQSNVIRIVNVFTIFVVYNDIYKINLHVHNENDMHKMTCLVIISLGSMFRSDFTLVPKYNCQIYKTQNVSTNQILILSFRYYRYLAFSYIKLFPT